MAAVRKSQKNEMPIQQIYVVYNNDDGEMILSKDGDWWGGDLM